MEIFNAFDNVFGGHDYVLNGSQYQTHQNISGGEDIYKDGLLHAQTQPNEFGGEDIYEGGKLVVSTHENSVGDQNVYSSGNLLEGSFHHDGSNINITDQNGILSSMNLNEMGNASTILDYADPLSHVGDYILPTLIL